MGDRRPGPICGSQLGKDWIDHGTMCRSRSSAPGPLGVAASFVAQLVMGATPEPDDMPGANAMFEVDINDIARSTFGQTDDGQQIVALLRKLLKRGYIVYGATGDDRGQWDGQQIKVNKEFYGNSCKTIVELVHEASHILWRKGHPITKENPETTEQGGANEYYAVKNQLAIYKWLQKDRHCSDALLDERLKREKEGKLKSSIMDAERENRETRQ